MKSTAAGIVMTALIATGIVPADAASSDGTPWSFPVTNTVNGQEAPGTWTPLPKADIKKPWKICVLFPHMKDPYWLAADYGIVNEAQRQNVNVQVYEAGGYTNLSTQLNQMDNCISQKFDAIILGAISGDGVSAQIRKAEAAGIPVIDFVNGVSEPKTAAHALVSFYDLAYQTGKYVVQTFGDSSPKVGFFPGPQGASWSDAAVKGFNDAIKGSKVTIVDTRRGDTGMNVQLSLIQNAMQAYPDMNFIVGVDIAAQAGAVAVRNSHKAGDIKVMAFDIIPGVYQDIAKGETAGSPSDFTVIQGRMAVDMALRLLEKAPMQANRSGPAPVMVTKDKQASLQWDTMFAPKDFSATYEVKAK
ncbi:Periplasmic protein TorT [Paraburkholderia nemoris]|uniref:Periplasmic protein TorT n=2 Tax=Paraburkholderia nemoris TaxID=2793076 RepID=A0ABM8SX64_9BURK|nr:Periplasmic protein TorT [Paraburkholderia nemoris]CAE6839616.1 Periplasmic protein TorT [Paraburkholderia nemoris]